MAPAPDETHLVSNGAGVTQQSGASDARGATPRLTANAQFGPYRVIRELGRGGMGEVYEAEEIDTGRRVALKLLSRALGDRQAIDRFLREGKLAAAVSHPNSVYVLGSHEIGGTPTIAMELVSGGTLEDVVESKGPMPSVDAVEATLQLVAGLEAAEARGVLHRDIKPSNGFVDAAGVVKIGDYGLSMSTTGLSDETRLTMAGTFLGTPAYASPEQVKAADVDVRSDIYSVGATLYFLLTGHPPFAQKNTMQVLAAVLQDMPASPRTIVATVPEPLAQVVLRCLKKDPAARFQTYAQLRQALQPLTRRTMTTAPWGRRIGAMVIDVIVLFPLLVPFSIMRGGVAVSNPLVRIVAEILLQLPYFAWLEARYGGSIGKRLVGLQVVSADGSPATLSATALRALIWLPFTMLKGVVDLTRFEGLSDVVGPLAYVVLFSTARRASGYRGIHEVVSGTRTVTAAPVRLFARRRRTVSIARPVSADSAPKTGGYAIQERLWERDGHALVAAWDTTLDRPVWVHHVPESTPVASAERQACARQTRLRWLASRRTSEERWDAYEAPDGGPLGLESWDDMLAMVSGLVAECEQAIGDGTMPPSIGLDRIWISPDGVARLTEFPIPGASPSPAVPVRDVRSAQVFLHAVTVAGLGGNLARVALPISVRTVLDRMGQGAFTTFRAWSEAIVAAGQSAPRVSKPRRLIAFALGSLMILAAFSGAISRIPSASALHQRPEAEALGLLLNRLLFVDGVSAAGPQWMSRHPASRYTAPERDAFRIYIGDRYASTIQDDEAWRLLNNYWTTDDAMKAAAARALDAAAAAPPEVRQQAASGASAILRDFDQRKAERSNFWLDQFFYVNSTFQTSVLPFAIISVMFAFMFRGSIVLRVLGCAIAGPDGTRASWFRALFRTVIAWLPIFVVYAVVRWGLDGRDLHAAVIPLTQVAGSFLLIGGALVALWRPDLSLHDRLAGTKVVPR